MTARDNYLRLLPTLRAIPAEQVKRQRCNLKALAQSADDLYRQCVGNREKLEAVGVPWELVESLPARADALHEAISQLLVAEIDQARARRSFKQLEADARDSRARLARVCRYALHDSPALLTPLRRMRHEYGRAHLISHLRLLVDMCRDNLALLRTAGLQPHEIDEAQRMADTLAERLPDLQMRTFDGDARDIRNRAATYIEQAAERIRRAAELIWPDPSTRPPSYKRVRARPRRATETPDPTPPTISLPPRESPTSESAG